MIICFVTFESNISDEEENNYIVYILNWLVKCGKTIERYAYCDVMYNKTKDNSLNHFIDWDLGPLFA